MINILSASFYLVIAVSSATDVYIIDTKPGGKSSQLSSTNDNPLQLLHQLFNSQNGRPLQTLKTNLAKTRKPHGKRSPLQNRLFRDMYGLTQKPKTLIVKKAPKPVYNNELDPFIQFLLSQSNNLLQENGQETHKYSDDYVVDFADVARVKAPDSFSQDYVDFLNLRSLRKNDETVKNPAVRTYSVESDADDSRETQKSKRFEIIKNKQNKKDIKSSDSGEAPQKKKKAKFKKNKKKHAAPVSKEAVVSHKKKKKHVSKEESNLSSDAELSSKSTEYAKQKSKKVKAKKEKKEEEENDDWNENKQPVELYLQGNKLVMYPPMEVSSGESSEETRRMRMPYFLPKRYNWRPDDIHNLGYFFFNGPKGFSLERK